MAPEQVKIELLVIMKMFRKRLSRRRKKRKVNRSKYKIFNLDTVLSN